MKRLALATAFLATLVTAHPTGAQEPVDETGTVADEVESTPQVECIIARESGGLDVYNRQGSGAAGPGQYFPSTWASHTALYRRATGFDGPLSLHSLHDVRVVMSFILGTYPYMRSAWTVRGCN